MCNITVYIVYVIFNAMLFLKDSGLVRVSGFYFD